MLITSCAPKEEIEVELFEDTWWETNSFEEPACFYLHSYSKDTFSYQEADNCGEVIADSGASYNTCYSTLGEWSFEHPNIYYWDGEKFIVNSSKDGCWKITTRTIFSEVVCKCTLL